ncbi:N-acetylgalactosamine-6-sulfatase [Thalassotalea sp. HSM 43]|uniref:sulfatase n=1 Tax=Thalassotalea sp. HSM 43 TaxID=2552945 RepID=UPI0010800C31|nr:sulfatase [Thalassotalea sp. HSM 43]QBY04237.1 N-acetylgalactosamine-6-sulfatase [Thalassotalea sp. HSM 43]
MKYLLILSALALAAFMPSCGHLEVTSTAPERPNVVVFVVDDMGVMDTSVAMLGKKPMTEKLPLNEWYRTPNMAQLAEQGVRFSQFYAQSVCSPTRASLLTGQNAARHHTTTWINPSENNRGSFGPTAWNWQGLNQQSVSFAQLLTQAGYQTIHIGKGHFGPLNSDGADPSKLGFDINIAGAAWGRPKSYYGRDHYGNHEKYQQTGQPLTHNIPHLQKYYDDDVFLTEALTLEANRQIRQAVAAQKPFLLYLSHYAVHAPFNSDPRFINNYQSAHYNDKAKAYASLVEGMDKSLGDVISTLKELGVDKETLIIFLGDNGSDAPLGGNNAIASSSPLRGKKGTSWEGGMRAPLIISWAGIDHNNPQQQQFTIANNQLNEQVATVLDIYPTILSATGLSNPEQHIIDGFELNAQLAGRYNNHRDNRFLMHFPHKHRHSYFTSLINGDWKLIYQYNPLQKNNVKRYQLYNLAKDVSESHDLAESEPDKLTAMMTLMINQLQQEGAQYPVDATGNVLRPEMPTQRMQGLTTQALAIAAANK